MRSILPIAILLIAASCAGPIETRIDSAGASQIASATIVVDESNANENPRARGFVIDVLGKKGFSVAPDGKLLLQVTMSERPAALSLSSGTAVLSPSAVKKRCAKTEYRLGIALTQISDGAEIYRAHAAEFHCKLALDAVLPVLVDAAMADLGNPRGSYILKRPR
jgi:hypothetical protein